MQRLRVRYRRGEEIKYISHLDMIRLWQRAFRRAGINVARSEGFNPRPRIYLAAPLALGVTSDAELMDVIIRERVSPHNFTAGVNSQLPAGAEILQVHEMPLEIPSLQSRMRFADYIVQVESCKSETQVKDSIDKLLSLEELPWQHMRDTGPHRYDLRKLIEDIWLKGCDEEVCTLGLRLRCDASGTGRPEQVTRALGFQGEPLSIHRTGLVFKAG